MQGIYTVQSVRQRRLVTPPSVRDRELQVPNKSVEAWGRGQELNRGPRPGEGPSQSGQLASASEGREGPEIGRRLFMPMILGGP